MEAGLQSHDMGRVSWYVFRREGVFFYSTKINNYIVPISLLAGEAISVSNVLLNRMGLKDVGPNKKAAKEAMKMRNSVRNFSSLDSGDS